MDLTVKDLEIRCNTMGWDISYAGLRNIEKQKRKVTDVELNHLCKALAVEIGELFP